MNETSGPTRTETLLGGGTVLVNFQNDATQPEAVKVRQLPIREYPAYQAAQEDEFAMIALLTGNKMEWAETITPESHETIITEGERINGDFFSRWAARQRKRRELLIPGYSEALLQSLNQPRSQTSSLKPPLKAV